jgi:hypothetical protein
MAPSGLLVTSRMLPPSLVVGCQSVARIAYIRGSPRAVLIWEPYRPPSDVVEEARALLYKCEATEAAPAIAPPLSIGEQESRWAPVTPIERQYR